MKALPVTELPVGDWLYELKFDGYRALAFKAGDEVRLISRNRKSFNDDYPVLIDSLKSLKTKSFTIDGEVTALDKNGRSSFQLLQGYGKAKHTPLVYYAFDLLSLDSADLRSRPLIERRKLLDTRNGVDSGWIHRFENRMVSWSGLMTQISAVSGRDV